MPVPSIIDYEVSAADVQMAKDGGSAMISLMTDNGRVVIGLSRRVLEHLCERTKHELERVAPPTRRRSDA